MTEFKRLTLLLGELQGHVDLLCQTLSGVVNMVAVAGINDDALHAMDIESIYSAAQGIKAVFENHQPRFQRILLKAREVDPDRKLYNEAMCEKIEKLFADYCRAACRLMETADATIAEEEVMEGLASGDEAILLLIRDAPPLAAAEDLYGAHMVARAQEEAWKERIATGLADVVLYEEQGRVVITAEEKNDRMALTEEHRANRNAIISVLREREAAKWAEEFQRRNTEHSHFQQAARLVNKGDIAGFIALHVPEHYQRQFGRYLHGLARALLATPEDMNIRRLLSNHPRTLHEYGHPCLQYGSCCCAAVAEAAHVLWYAMGYVVQYSSSAAPSIPFLLSRCQLEDVVMPCGSCISAHDYISVGFEDYSERYLELKEPDPMMQSDRWFEWYNKIRSFVEQLPS